MSRLHYLRSFETTTGRASAFAMLGSTFAPHDMPFNSIYAEPNLNELLQTKLFCEDPSSHLRQKAARWRPDA